jgi:trigger factor
MQPNAEFRAHVRADAEMKVRAGLLMAEIAKAKEVKVTDADIEKAFEELAEQTGKNVAKVKAEYRDQKKREMLVGMVLEDKILDLVEAAAKVTEETKA